MQELRLAGVAEIAAALAVSRQHVYRLVRREDFPAPVAQLAAGKIWLLDDIERWAVEHADRRAGRPETPRPDAVDLQGGGVRDRQDDQE